MGEQNLPQLCARAGPAVTTAIVSTITSELYRGYKAWCEENGHKPLSSARIADEWIRLCFEKYRAAGKPCYKSVRLRLPSE